MCKQRFCQTNSKHNTFFAKKKKSCSKEPKYRVDLTKKQVPQMRFKILTLKIHKTCRKILWKHKMLFSV